MKRTRCQAKTQAPFSLMAKRRLSKSKRTDMARPITTAILAVILGICILEMPLPASAGSVTLMLTPHGESADLIQQGLRIYSAIEEQKNKKRKRKNHAHVDQQGRDNAAALSQKGVDNNGVIVQRGRDHAATVAQEGEHNAFGLFQFGYNTSLDVVQAGHGQVGLVLQGGW
jgi:hypothetical protein